MRKFKAICREGNSQGYIDYESLDRVIARTYGQCLEDSHFLFTRAEEENFFVQR
jgi:hypothetical protein